MKKMQHMTLYGGVPPQVSAGWKPAPGRCRSLTTADILARGVQLVQVLQAVNRLRPTVEYAR